MDRKPKITFQLDSPFTSSQWPEVPAGQEETILELLCSILSPLGQRRLNHIVPSKGKRSKKRRRLEIAQNQVQETIKAEIPPIPEISSFVSVGLNIIVRNLERLSNLSQVENVRGDALDSEYEAKEVSKQPFTDGQSKSDGTSRYSAIFVLKSTQPMMIYDHIPQLVASASLAEPNMPATRLVQLPKSCGPRLCQALGLPRVSIIGILDGAPHVMTLLHLLRAHIQPVEIPWLHEAKASEYLPVKINVIETSAPVAIVEKMGKNR